MKQKWAGVPSTRWPLFVLVAVALVATLIFIPASVARGQNAAQPEPIVVRVYFDTQTELNRLAVTLDVWEVNHVDGYVLALIEPQQRTMLAAQDLVVVTDLTATQRLYDVRTLAAPANRTDAGIPGFACYRTVEETYTDLATLAAAHPNLATWVDIGDSWDKTIVANKRDGYDLHTLVLTNRESSAPKSTLFVMSAIHARELATAELTTRFGEYLVSGYGEDPDITWLLDHNEIHILPLANPDGRKFAEQLEYWRKNTNNTDGCTSFPNYGVDLNRNSSFKWNQCKGSGCSSAEACAITYRGSAPASEPEVQAFQDYVLGLFPDQRGPNDEDAAPDDATGLFLTLHSYGRLVLYPWGWNTDPSPNASQLRTLGRKFGADNDYAVCQVSQPGCIYQVDGSSDDWAYGELGVAAFTFEIGTEFFQSCSRFEEEIVPDNLDALIYAIKAARQPYLTPAGPETLSVSVDPPVVIAGQTFTLTAQLDDSRYASNGFGIEPTQPISAARFTIDAPSWITDTDHMPLTAADGKFDSAAEEVFAVVDTSTWAIGRHLILVEGEDADGNWGVPTAVFVRIAGDVIDLDVNPQLITGRGYPGTMIAYTATVTNTGSVTDNYDIVVEESGWTAISPATIDSLAPGAIMELGWSVQVPAGSVVGATDSAVISISSQTDPSLKQTIRTDSTAAARLIFLPVVSR